MTWRPSDYPKNPYGACSRKNPCDLCGGTTGQFGTQAGRTLTCPKAHVHTMCGDCHNGVPIGFVQWGDNIRLEVCPFTIPTKDRVLTAMQRRL